MELNEKLRLSYYQKVSDIDAKQEVSLVKHTEEGRFFVLKNLTVFDHDVLCLLKEGRYPGIPAIRDLIRTEEGMVVIEEYISGSTLKTQMEEKLFKVDDVAQIILWLCRILEPLHGNDPPLIHRDIKPSNVMINDEGKVFLIDFDAGKFYSEGKERDTVLIGTEGYAAPEQYGFGQSDARTDIYSMGVLGKELLDQAESEGEGQAAFANAESDKKAANSVAENGAYREALKAVFEKCTAMSPEDRFHNVSELACAVIGANSFETKEGTHGGSAGDVAASKPHTGESAKEIPAKRNKDYTGSYLPPGFRTHDPKCIALAVLWYGFIIYYGVHNIMNRSPGDELTVIDHIFVSLTMVMITFLAGNYRGIADRLPLTKSDSLKVRIAGYICWGFLIMIGMIAISTFLDALI